MDSISVSVVVEPTFSTSTTFEDILNLKKSEIQLYLKSNRLKSSGTKSDLARQAYEFHTSASHSQLLIKAPKDVPSTQDTPDISELKLGWTSDLSLFPNVTHTDVEEYLVNSSHRTSDLKKMECYRQFIRGYNFFKEGYIHKVMINSISQNSIQCYVRSKCYPSMKQGTYNQWMLIAREPFIVLKAYCSCPAGLGEGCTHIAGLLFALEDIQVDGSPKNEVACTAKPCEWNKPSKRPKENKTIDAIHFKRVRYMHEVVERKPAKEIQIKKNDVSFLESMCAKLKTTNAVVFDILDVKRKANLHVPIEIYYDLNVSEFEEVATSEHIIFESDKYVNLETQCKTMSKENFMTFLKEISDSVVNEIQERTKGQSENELWHKCRKARITASVFHDIKIRKQTTPSEKLVEKLLGRKPEVSVAALEWGRRNESIAKKRYKAFKKLKYKQTICVKEKGLYIFKGCGFLGASPDGVVEINSCESHLMEVKCPYKWRNKTVLEACQCNDFYCYVDANGEIKLKENHRYYTQIQGQMAICEFNKCDFVIYTKTDMNIIEVRFDRPFWESLLIKLKLFYNTFVVPALFLSQCAANES